MTVSNFWDHVTAIESDYAEYRKRLLAKFSLTAAECDILLFLANNPTRDTAAEIAKIRRIPKSQVSLSVASLSSRGLIIGRKIAGNRKSIHLSLTEEAEPIIDAGMEMQRDFSRMLFDDFTEEEKAEFLRLHAKIADTAKKQRGKEPWNTER